MTDCNALKTDCPVCGAKEVWFHNIDDTNCDASGFIPDDDEMLRVNEYTFREDGAREDA